MKITIAQVIEAAEQNGFKWTKEKFYNDKGDITEACILGQVALNLNVAADNLLVEINYACDSAGTEIWQYNDSGATSYRDALRFLKRSLKIYKDRSIDVRRSNRKRRLVRKSGI